MKDFHELMEIFDKYEVNFVSITQNFDTQSPTGRLLRNILLTFAQFEREMTADRTRDKMQQRAQKGMWNGGIPAYGYKAKDKRLVRNTPEARRVAFMFEHFTNTGSFSELREELKRRGWMTRSEKAWSKSSLHQLLRNPLYTGVVKFNDKTYAGLHKALVTNELFGRAQEILPKRHHAKSNSNRTFLLKGLLLCSDCGSRMTPHYTQKRRSDRSSYRIHYYRCTKTMQYDNKACRIKQLNANDIERTIVEYLHDLSKNDRYVSKTVEVANQERGSRIEPLEKEAARLKSRLVELNSEIDRFVVAIGKGTLSVDRLEMEMAAREGDKQTLKSELEELQKRLRDEATTQLDSSLILQALFSFRTSFSALPPTDQAETLQCLLKDVLVCPDKLTMEIFELPEFATRGGSTKRTKWLLIRNPLRNVLGFFCA